MSCVCGHSKEEHGGDAAYPNATDCHVEDFGEDCECAVYEESEEDEEDKEDAE